ncbi:MAG: glycosyltransferase [Bacilli bacterium]|jgi:glycosyltransferase involved in cell wall biosynthesis
MSIEDFRLLIVSNNCLSYANSNGRTLLNLVSSFPDEKIANFYIHDEVPDNNHFSNFYRVTDQEAYQAFKGRGPVGGCVAMKTKDSQIIHKGDAKNGKSRKNPLFSLARELVWKSGAWKANDFASWLDAFNPQAILLQGGDAPFLFALARKIAAKRKIPLVIYNSEDYFFKKYNYMENRYRIFYPIFHNKLVKEMRKAIRSSSLCLYNSDELMKQYTASIPHRAEVIMTSASFSPKDVLSNSHKNAFHISYLGNLSVGRQTSLIEIANVLVEHRLVLDVYGLASDEVRKELEKIPAIKYHGFVSYERVKEIMLASRLLVHAESFGEYAIKDLKHAFSTKIADSLASGVPFFIYAPKELTETQYLMKLIPQFVATNKEELQNKLRAFLAGQSVYLSSENIKSIIDQNHSLANNQAKFKRLLTDIIDNRKE